MSIQALRLENGYKMTVLNKDFVDSILENKGPNDVKKVDLNVSVDNHGAYWLDGEFKLVDESGSDWHPLKSHLEAMEY